MTSKSELRSRRGPWWAALGVCAAIAIASCAGDDGEPGQDGRDGKTPRLPVARGEALPGFVVEVLGVSGGTAPTGNFQSGDEMTVRFTVKDSDGEDIPKDQWDRLRMYVSGPTFNYQRVIAPTDVLADAMLNADGEWEVTLPAFPDFYLEPENYTGAFTDGVMAGDALLSGTYTLGIEGRQIVEVEGGEEVRDPGNAHHDFLFGDATTIDTRRVVGEDNCLQCHVQFRAHGDNRRDLALCLLCHTAGAEDRNNPDVANGTPGVSVDFRIMIHKIHTGAFLPSVLGMTTSPNGSRDYSAAEEPYEVMGFGDRLHDYSHVKFPLWPNFAQPMPRDTGYGALSSDAQSKEDAQRSGPVQCYVCHGDPDDDGPIEAPEDGDLVYSQPSRDACMSCHEDWVWDRPYTANGQTMPASLGNETCTNCHGVEGDALDVRDAHEHPLLDTDIAPGVVVDFTDISEAGTNDGDGTVDVGEKIAVEMTVETSRGVALDASTLDRLELTITGPTSNPNTVQLFALPQEVFSGSQPYQFNVPEKIWLEKVGESTGVGGEVFPGTQRAPHWDVGSTETVVMTRGANQEQDQLLEMAPRTQNYVDVSPAAALDGVTAFARDAYVIIDEGQPNEEFMRIQYVEEMSDRRRLWFSSIYTASYPAVLQRDHAMGATVQAVGMNTLTRDTDYSLDPATGVVTEINEFGDGVDVLVTYVADFVLPDVYQGTLNDSPALAQDWGDWRGLPIVSGTYTMSMSIEDEITVSRFGEDTSYTDGSPSNVTPFLVGDATEVELQDRIDAPVGCIACHADIQFHGDHRRGYETCLQCHGAAGAEDRPDYVAPIATDNGVSIEFRRMLHKIHAGSSLTNPEDYVIWGFGFGYPNNSSPHTYEEVGFPVFAGGVKNCASCHGADNEAWKEPADRNHPTAMSAAPTRSWRAACVSCHNSAAAEAHADVNTNQFGVESCAVCHGPGADLSVEVVHFVR